MVTRPYGYVELIFTLGEDRDTKMVDSQVLVFPYKIVYNYILGETLQNHLRHNGLPDPPQAKVS